MPALLARAGFQSQQGECNVQIFSAHRKPIYALAFSADGKLLATSAGDETVRLWSLATLTKVRELPGSRFWCPLALSSNGRWLARGGYGVRVWDLGKDAAPTIATDQFTEAVAFAPDGKILAAHGNSSRPLTRWSLPSAKPLAGGWGGTRESTGGSQFPCGTMLYHPAGKLLATVFGVSGSRGYNSVIYLWDARTGKLKCTLRADYASAHPVTMAFSFDGLLLAAAYGPLVRVWSVAAAKEVAAWKASKKHVKGLAFTRDGKRLISVSGDELARYYDTKKWKEASTFDSPIGKLVALTASIADDRMASGSATGKVVVW